MADKLDRLKADKDGIIHNIDAEKISKSSNVAKNTKTSIQLRKLSEPSSKNYARILL